MQLGRVLMRGSIWMVMIAACGGSARPPVGPRDDDPRTAEAMIAQLAAFRDDMCTCSTTQCADEVDERMTEWGERMAEAVDAHETEPPTGDEITRVAELAEAATRCMAFVTATSAARPATAGDPSEPQNAAPTALAPYRVAGNANIVPDDDVRNAVKGRQLVSRHKLCIDIGGNVRTVETLTSSGYANYDARIRREMRAWKYRPYRIDGAAAPVCTMVTFHYSQWSAPRSFPRGAFPRSRP